MKTFPILAAAALVLGTDAASAPVLNVSGKTVTMNGTVKVKVSAADRVRLAAKICNYGVQKPS